LCASLSGVFQAVDAWWCLSLSWPLILLYHWTADCSEHPRKRPPPPLGLIYICEESVTTIELSQRVRIHAKCRRRLSEAMSDHMRVGVPMAKILLWMRVFGVCPRRLSLSPSGLNVTALNSRIVCNIWTGNEYVHMSKREITDNTISRRRRIIVTATKYPPTENQEYHQVDNRDWHEFDYTPDTFHCRHQHHYYHHLSLRSYPYETCPPTKLKTIQRIIAWHPVHCSSRHVHL